jgi:chromosome partitioning protein
MKILAVATQKGGVGKSATTQALGVVLANAHGRRTLMVDVDPQSSLTLACGVTAEERSLAEVLDGKAKLGDVLVELDKNLWLAPADIALANTELFLAAQLGRETVLKRALVAAGSRFDVCLIDCPPSLGLLTINALTAADAVLIPTQPQVADLRGVRLFLSTLEKIREVLNPSLETLGIVATFYDNRLLHHRDAIETMKAGGLPLLPVFIGRSVRVAEAAAAGQSVITYEPSNKQTAAYRELAEIVNQWLNDPRKT